MFDGFAARLPARDPGLYPLVFQRIAEPVSIIAPVGKQPFGLRQAVQKGGRVSVIVDLACGHEEAERPALGVGDGMQLGVHAALRAADQTAPLVACTPFLTAGWSPSGAP